MKEEITRKKKELLVGQVLKEISIGNVEDKIKRLELKRDNLLSTTIEDSLKSKIKSSYNRRIAMLKKYGVEYPLQSKEIRDKIIKTNIEKYGSKSILGNKEFREKYDINNNFKKIDVKRKTMQTSIRKYRVAHPQQNPFIKLKIKKTKLLRYGTANGRRKKEK